MAASIALSGSTGNQTTTTTPIRLMGVSIVGTALGDGVVLRDAGASGTILVSAKTNAAGASANIWLGPTGVIVPSGIVHATVTGTAPGNIWVA